jgi:hypothetical protein
MSFYYFESGLNLYRLTENSKNGVARFVLRKKNNGVADLGLR